MLDRKRAPVPARMLNQILNADIRAFHKLLEIFQKVSRNFSKSCSKNNRKLVFARKVVQKLLEKKQKPIYFWSDAKGLCNNYLEGGVLKLAK